MTIRRAFKGAFLAIAAILFSSCPFPHDPDSAEGAEIFVFEREIAPGGNTRLSLKLHTPSPAMPVILWQTDSGSIEQSRVANEAVFHAPAALGRYEVRANVTVGDKAYEATTTVLVRDFSLQSASDSQALASQGKPREEYSAYMFSDASPLYLSPSEPRVDSPVTVKLRCRAQSPGLVYLHVKASGAEVRTIPMARKKSDALFDFYTAEIPPAASSVQYWFEWRNGVEIVFYSRSGPSQEPPSESERFSYLSGSRIPSWIKGAWLYRIVPDRFFNGDASNDPAGRLSEWRTAPLPSGSPKALGGDIAGMERKLEYLKGLGIDVLLLDSIFDKDLRIEARYSSAQASQAGPESVLSQLLTKTRGRGIKLIADSSVAGLPDPGDALIGFAAELVSRSSGLNGFRLPASRAASRDGSYYQRFIEALKKSNPEAVAMSPSGSEGGPAMAGFDLVSSPKTFLEPLSRYLTGLAPGDPKPSGYNDAAAFAAAIAAAQLKLPQNAVLCSALSLDEPELPRLSTRLMERAEAKADDAKDGEAAWLGAYREALVLQMTMPGSPLSLYGAETALEGGKGNDSLRGFPWGAENRELIGLCRDLAGLRKTMPALRSGSYLALAADASGFFAFTRWDGKSRAIVLANNAAERRLFSLQAAKAGLADGDRVKTVLASSEAGHLMSGTTYQIKDNLLSVSLPPHGCLIMSASISHEDPPSPEKGPSLLRSFPTDKAKELAADTRIIMEFSEEMEQDSVLDSFRIEPEMPGSFVWNGNTCTFVPEKGFEAKTRYTVSLGSGLRARKGGFSMKMGKSITFTTH